MHTYTIKDIKALVKDEGYLFACLMDQNEQKVINFNKDKAQINAKLLEIEKKLQSKVLPEGVYFVCVTNKIGRGQHLDKLPIVKGMQQQQQQQNGQTIILQEPGRVSGENVLTYTAALEYQREISELSFNNKFLEQQNKLLQEKIDQLEAELEEAEEAKKPSSGLSELSENTSWIKGLAEAALPALDRYFDIQQRRIELEEKKLASKQLPPPAQTKQPVKIKIGSKEHLQIIEDLYNAGKEQELNKNLDALQKNNPEMYLKVMEHLNLETEEEEEQQPGQGQE